MDAALKGPRRSASIPLSLISQNVVSPRDARRVLTDAFTADDYLECIADLTKLDVDPQAYIDGLDRVGPVYSHLNKSGTLTFGTCPSPAHRHPKAWVKSYSPQSPSTTKGMRNLRAPSYYFTPSVRGTDPDGYTQWETTPSRQRCQFRPVESRE